MMDIPFAHMPLDEGSDAAKCFKVTYVYSFTRCITSLMEMMRFLTHLQEVGVVFGDITSDYYFFFAKFKSCKGGHLI